jgi:prepilin-type N-terminal cleavage/methylation domain-containing protein
MKKRKGFTLIELMVVILIVSILAAVAIPIMRGRIDSAKWSEGRAMMGTIATAIRAYTAGEDEAPGDGTLSTEAYAALLGFTQADLTGTYFTPGMFEVSDCTYDVNNVNTPLTFTIEATNADLEPDGYTLDERGAWTAQ